VGNFTDADGVFDGSMYIENSALTTLDGMQPVRRVNGSLGLRFNDDLLDIAALQSLEAVDGRLTIQNNRLLRSLDGLGSLGFVLTQFYVMNNTALEKIDGLDALNSTYGSFYISDNSPSLTSVELNNLESVGLGYNADDYFFNSLTFEGNSALRSVSLASLQATAGDFDFMDNPNLVDVRAVGLRSCNSFTFQNNSLGPTLTVRSRTRAPAILSLFHFRAGSHTSFLGDVSGD